MGLPVRQRLRTANDYAAVRREGKRCDCGPFLLQLYSRTPDQDTGHGRLGIIASRKVGKAVKRNHAKRIFREIFRNNQSLLPERSDLVLLIRPFYNQYTFSQLEVKYQEGCQKLFKK